MQADHISEAQGRASRPLPGHGELLTAHCAAVYTTSCNNGIEWTRFRAVWVDSGTRLMHSAPHLKSPGLLPRAPDTICAVTIQQGLFVSMLVRAAS